MLKIKKNIPGSSLTWECSLFIFNMANAAEAKQLACELPAWLIAHKHAPPCLQASNMPHCSQACTTLPTGFQHGSLLTNKHRLASRLPACLIAHKHAPPCLQASGMAHGSWLTTKHHLIPSPLTISQTLPAASAYRNNTPAHTFRPVL